MISGFSDHRPSPGMSDQYRRPILVVQYDMGCSDVIFQGSQGILYDRDLVSPLSKDLPKGPPAGTVCERAMNQYDIFDCVCHFVRIDKLEIICTKFRLVRSQIRWLFFR